MAHDADRYTHIIRQIEAAFADVAYPGDDRMLHPDCFDDMHIRAFYGSTSWKDVPCMTIARENAAFSGASAAAFRFLIPAYMTWVLENIDEGDISVEHTLWSLDPDFSNGRFRDFQLSKFTLLSREQRAAVVAFLTALVDHPDIGEDAKAALKNHWRPGT